MFDAESFLDGMYAEEPRLHDWIDGWASHAYPRGPFREPAGDQVFKVDYLYGAENPRRVEAEPGVVNRGINGYLFDLQKLRGYGAPELPVWVTETGWRHVETEAPSSDHDGATIAAEVGAARMVEALAGPTDGGAPVGYTPWLRDPRVRAVLFFGFDGDPVKWGHTSWLRINTKGQILGAYAPFDALRALQQRGPGR